MKFLVLVLVALSSVIAAMADARKERVAQTSAFELYSAFWPNLHHTLYAVASARRPHGKSLAGHLPEPLEGQLTPEERTTWETAVAYYEQNFAGRDLLFGDDMVAINNALAASGAKLSSPGLREDLRAVLVKAAPVYRRYWWPVHDLANRTWIADAASRVKEIEPAVKARISQLMLTPWYKRPVRVDVVRAANWQGAYTSIEFGVHITIASGDSELQEWSRAEILFHEASHGLINPLRDRLQQAAQRDGKQPHDLWHVVLFYTVGEVVQQTLASRRINYTPYLYSTGLFQRAWPKLQKPIEQEWAPYIRGQIPADQAVKHLVAAL